MVFPFRNIIGVLRVNDEKEPSRDLIFHGFDRWPKWLRVLYTHAIESHSSNFLALLVAIVCYYVFFVFTDTIQEAREWKASWMLKVIAFNLSCEFLTYGLWHWLFYSSSYARGPLKKRRFNPNNQYEQDGKPVGMFFSTSGLLQREILLTTLGFVQSSLFQCAAMWLYANDKVPHYMNFWSYPLWSVGMLMLVPHWRAIHFFAVHRMIHPWWNTKNGLAQGDIGAFLYRWVHSLHHKSYNPGPWAGLSMHPIEHFIFFSCAFLPLALSLHPLHFLYVKFHANISPISGHDSFGDPGGNVDFHYLHHVTFERNYGVPLVNLDRMFGTYLKYDDYKKKKNSVRH